jgi:hypothetical protein
MLAQRLLLLIAVLATLVVLGSWDNRRQMERVLEQGYAATARITGAQYQRKMPLAVDGWRPRFVEQELSVDLQWEGKDGKPREYKKVPVTESLARTIVSGDQVRLMPVGIRALDDDLSVPVIVTDAAPRLASLKSWSEGAGYVALAAWVGFAGLTLWRRRTQRSVVAPARVPSLANLPPKRSLAGVGLLLIGGFVAYQAWSVSEESDAARAGGTAVTAEILNVTETSGGGHAVQLAWKDAPGAVRHFGPVRIGEPFYRKITKEGALVVHQTEVRTHEGPQERAPTIVADLPDEGWLERFGVSGGATLIVLGLGCLFSALRSAGWG